MEHVLCAWHNVKYCVTPRVMPQWANHKTVLLINLVISNDVLLS